MPLEDSFVLLAIEGCCMTRCSYSNVEVFIIWWLLSISVVVPESAVLCDCCDSDP